jgi:hypothetical protein
MGASLAGGGTALRCGYLAESDRISLTAPAGLDIHSKRAIAI